MLKRYDLMQVNVAYTTDHEMERSDDGEWVRYEDIEQLTRLLDVVGKALADFQNAPDEWCDGVHTHSIACQQARAAIAELRASSMKPDGWV